MTFDVGIHNPQRIKNYMIFSVNNQGSNEHVTYISIASLTCFLLAKMHKPNIILKIKKFVSEYKMNYRLNASIHKMLTLDTLLRSVWGC